METGGEAVRGGSEGAGLGTTTLAISVGAVAGFSGGIVLVGSAGVSRTGLASSTGFGAGGGNTAGIRDGSAGAGLGKILSAPSLGISLTTGGISSLFADTSGLETTGGDAFGGVSLKDGARAAVSLLVVSSATRTGAAGFETTAGGTFSFAGGCRKGGDKAAASFFGGSLTISFATRDGS